VIDTRWLEAAFAAARPQAVGALLRHFRNLDLAEEAFQEACLRALTHWPKNGPPRDATAWLVFVGRNIARDHLRKSARLSELPEDEAQLSDLDDVETAVAHSMDHASVGDDVLRLLFVCCHETLPATQQIALALRIVAGLSVAQIARAFLVSDAALEQRITRAKRRIAEDRVPFETPGPAERAQRLGAVAAMLYLLFNEGYSADAMEADARAPFCVESVRLTRLLIRLFPGQPELLGLLALMLFQDARRPARFTGSGEIVLLEDQDRRLWRLDQIAEGVALLEKALRHRSRGPYQIQAAIAALHARAPSWAETDWDQIERLYAALEHVDPSPVVTLNRAVAVSKTRGAKAALDMVEPLRERLANYFYLHGLRGALLAQSGEAAQARDAFARAIALAQTPAQANHIRMQIERLQADAAEAKKATSHVGAATARTSSEH
jgi:RNA polymerase sigma-70 factor (ECF subfamily)